jgi:hypothetical protein
MVIGSLAAMLILSGVLSIGAVQPVLHSFLLFVVVSLVHLTVCVAPGYFRVGARRSSARPMSRVRQTRGAPVARSEA